MSWLHRELETMDPSIFLHYSPTPPHSNMLPQESKLATYMNRTYPTPPRSMNQAFGKLSLETSPTAIKKVLITEFVPMNYFAQPNIMQPESPEIASPIAMENVGGTTYFYSTNPDSMNVAGGMNSSASIGVPESCMGAMVGPPAVSPYAPQMYAMPSANIGAMSANTGLAQSFYMTETIRSEIYERNDDVFLQTDVRQFPDIPENVEMYTELIPIESAQPHARATSFRATHRQSGEHYALRRLHNYCTSATKRLEMWKQIDHPNVARLLDWFTTNAFGDHSLVLVYTYHPACATLMNKYLYGNAGMSNIDVTGGYHDPFSSDPDAPRPYTHQKNAILRAVASGAMLPEAVMWSMIVQLTAALRAIHTAGLACSLNPTKVVMNGCRVRVSWSGSIDAIHANPSDVAQAQQDDLTSLGRLALALACRTIHCENLAASMELVGRTYSADLKNLILYLITPSPARRTVTDLMPMIGARFYTQIEALERRADVFEEQLAREIDNGRLLRILIKLGVINERPELNLDPSWAETGDRYMLKLFRDYLFHSVTADGRPWLDQSHLAHSLNQLDGGTSDRVELMSRDEQSVLVVTYSELKHGLEQAFDEVMQAAAGLP